MVALLRSSATLCAGFIMMPGSAATEWTFQLGSDDGSYLYIDGNVVVANGGVLLRTATTVCAKKSWDDALIRAARHNRADGHGTLQHHDLHCELDVRGPA